MEEYYGVKLFSFQGRKLRLTREGNYLKQSLARLFHNEEYLREQMACLSNPMQNLHFGATLTVGEFMMTKPLVKILKEHPSAKVSMTVKNTQILLELLDSGQIDFAVVEGEFPKSQYAHQQFCVEEFISICGKNYSLQDGELSFQELFQEPLLLREEGSGTRHILEQAMQNAGYAFGDFSNVITIENMHVIKELVSSNCGITFLYRSAVEQELADGKLRRIPMKDFSLWHEISFVWKKDTLFASKIPEVLQWF